MQTFQLVQVTAMAQHFQLPPASPVLSNAVCHLRFLIKSLAFAIGSFVFCLHFSQCISNCSLSFVGCLGCILHNLIYLYRTSCFLIVAPNLVFGLWVLNNALCIVFFVLFFGLLVARVIAPLFCSQTANVLFLCSELFIFKFKFWPVCFLLAFPTMHFALLSFFCWISWLHFANLIQILVRGAPTTEP